MRRRVLVLALLSMVAACEGPAGPAGPTGLTGPSGVPPGYLNVLDFGANPDQASFDNTASFQRALDSAAKLGGGVVWVPVGRFWFAGNLSIGANVVLAGADVGPYDPGGEDPVSITVAPTLLPTSVIGSAFISIGQGSALQDVLIIYPNQVAPNAPGVATTGPIPYPPTVLVLGSANVFRSTLVNSYKGIDVEIGRVILENLDLGAFMNDITIDNAEDFVQISHITAHVYWDFLPTSPGFPQPIDTWVGNNGVALTCYRVDGLTIEDFNVFWRNTAIALLDSPKGLGAADGIASNVELQAQYGIVARSTKPAGFEVTNLAAGGNGGGYMIWLPAGGSQTPRVVVAGGDMVGAWLQPLNVGAGTLLERDITLVNPIGWLPAIGLVPPALPASGVAYVSTMPTVARVSISGGSVQDVQLSGKTTAITSGIFELYPGESIAVIYTSAPTWSWDLE